MTDDDVLLIETEDRVRTLTLNRPKARNALSSALRTQFFAALRGAEAEDDVDVVILTGADPVFCAGLDLKELGDSTDLPDISPQWPAMTKPVIGAVNGAAVTGGLEFALYCDILIASEQARFADTHARVGLLPTWGLSVRLPQKVGLGLARRMSLTGDYLSAADALRAGLVTEVVPHDRPGAAGVVSPHRRRRDHRGPGDRGGVGGPMDEQCQRRRHRRQPRRGAATRARTGALARTAQKHLSQKVCEGPGVGAPTYESGPSWRRCPKGGEGNNELRVVRELLQDAWGHL
jgi:enoyl-CoA hydratase